MNDNTTVAINDPLMAYSLSICYFDVSAEYLLVQVRFQQIDEMSFLLFS